MPDTDPNKVRLTGENSFIRLQLEENGAQMTRISHWRILYSPGGPGHRRLSEDDAAFVPAHAVHVLRGTYRDGRAAADRQPLQGAVTAGVEDKRLAIRRKDGIDDGAAEVASRNGVHLEG